MSISRLPQLGIARTLYKSLAGTPLSTKVTIIASRVSARIRPMRHRLRRRLQTGHISLVYKMFGDSIGNRFFWTSKSTSKTWYETESRLGWLVKRRPAAVGQFVELAIRKGRDPITFVGLAHAHASQDILRSKLSHDAQEPHKDLMPHIQRDQAYAAAYTGIIARHLGADAAKSADAFVKTQHDLPRKVYDGFLDSMSLWATTRGQQRTFVTGLESRRTHRLIILESAKNVDDYKFLFDGADHVTVIDMTDIYGKTDLSEYVAGDGPQSITVEHVRTRITRFSPAYHQLHADTKAAANLIVKQLEEDFGSGAMLFGERSGHFALDVSDQLFFQTLKARALKELLADRSFDHIVVACHNPSPSQAYYGLLSCVPGIATDARIEFMSTSKSAAARQKTRACVATATASPTHEIRQNPHPSASDIKADLLRKVQGRASMMEGFTDDNRKRLLFLVNNNSAHNKSSVSYIKLLTDDYQVKTAFIGSSLGAILRSVKDAEGVITPTVPVTISHGLLPDLSDLSRWLQQRFLEASEQVSSDDIRDAMRRFAGPMVRNSMLSAVANKFLFRAWLEHLQQAHLAPDLVLLCPQRSAKLGVLSDVARYFDVPTVALEPHGLNGNYCRYSKVATDYYAVISDYFRKTAESDFGISTERCYVIGSPRIVAPQNYDPAAAQSRARSIVSEEQSIDFSTGIFGTFFCQPSEWDHVAKVWRNILTATDDLGIHILLKTHPEESPARVAQYLKIATEVGASNRVSRVDGDPDIVIEASDFMLTAYSAAAIDAAVLQKPVFCVTAENKPYPVDQHEIIKTSMSGSAAELRDNLTRYLENPDLVQQTRADFLAQEPQFIDGPDQRLRTMVDDILQTPSKNALRPISDLPETYFLEGPFTPFSV